MKSLLILSPLWLLQLGQVLATPPNSRELFQLAPDFYDDRCHPCIGRNEYTVQVLGAANQDWPQIQSAMEQASRDTQIALEFTVFEASSQGVQEMAQVVRRKTQAKLEHDASQDPTTTHVQALIVTFPETTTTETLEQAVAEALQTGLPVFGYGAGYQKATELGILGFVAQDEFVAGQVVAEGILERVHAKVAQKWNINNNRQLEQQQVQWAHTKTALFVTASNHVDATIVRERYEGIQTSFQTYAQESILAYNTSISSVEIQIDIDLKGAVLTQSPEDPMLEDFEQMSPPQLLEGCQYDILILDGDDATDWVMEALEQSPCNETLVAVFSDFVVTQQTRERLLQHTIAFAATPQIYLQSVFVVLMASVYTSTGKKLALPVDSEGVFLSGPKIVAPGVRNKLPEDSITNCEAYAFPICDLDTADAESGQALEPFHTPVLDNAPALSASERRVCNEQGCIDRSGIRIAGVLHGVTTSLFWKPIYASAKQTALDMGVTLEMEPFEPQENRDIMWEKMSFRIRSFCESGVDGIMVTIPSEALLDAIRFCQKLNVPVVSINSGAKFSQQLGLMAHIGQMEYNAGYGGGQRLIKEGMKEGYCLNHNTNEEGLLERCRGFEAAIADADGVVYGGMVQVSGDDVTRYKVSVETAVEATSGRTTESWEGIGLMTLSTSNVDSALFVLEDHPEAILGTFDVGERIYGPLAEGRLKFGIDQQALLQGIFPVYLLTYAAYTKQTLQSKLVETGPHFLDAAPTEDQQVCENNYFAVCPEIPDEQMNALPDALVGIGYFLVSLTLSASIICAAWTFYYRSRSELVRVSQPPFLIALVVGIAISSLSILFMSVETEYQTLKSEFTGLLTEEENPEIAKANASCMAVYWLQGIGNAIAFVSLFSKIWKIQMVFKAGERCKRIEVGMKDILPYASVLMVVVLGILIAWQVVDPFIWTRTVELEDDDGLALESYGECWSDKGGAFLMSLLCFQLVYLLYALVLCWRTKDIPSDFAESNYVSLCVICIFQVSILAIPIAAMVRDDPAAFYFVRACAVFLENFTTLCLMFIPKMWRVAHGQDKLTLIRRSSLASSSYQGFQSSRSGSRGSIARGSIARGSSGRGWSGRLDPQGSSGHLSKKNAPIREQYNETTITMNSTRAPVSTHASEANQLNNGGTQTSLTDAEVCLTDPSSPKLPCETQKDKASPSAESSPKVEAQQEK